MDPKNKRTFLIIGGAAAALLLLAGKTALDAKSLNFDVKDFKLDGTGGTISLSIINPSNSSYTLNAITCNVEVNDSRVATINYVGTVIIMPLATTTIVLNMSLDPAGIIAVLVQGVTSVVKASNDGSDPADAVTETITITGSANVDTIMIPISTTLAAIKV